jgi:hypothetical protein
MKKLATFATAVLLIALVAWAGDPWKSKSFAQWNENDANVILNQSPFSKMINISTHWRPADTGTNAGTVNTASGGGSTQTVAIAAEHGPSTDDSDYSFRVAWYSSQIVRAAMARLEVLHHAKSEAEAEKLFSSKMDDYIVLVQGANMGPFNKRPEKDFQGLAYLQMKKSKAKISPSKVEYIRASNGTVGSVMFYFPRKGADGQPTIPADEKGMDFVCPFEKTAIRNYFEPAKMVAQNGQDM